MTITVQQLAIELDCVDDNAVIKIQHDGTVLYAHSIQIEGGEIIISSEEPEDDDTEEEE